MVRDLSVAPGFGLENRAIMPQFVKRGYKARPGLMHVMPQHLRYLDFARG
jgi:hypothetical protein